MNLILILGLFIPILSSVESISDLEINSNLKIRFQTKSVLAYIGDKIVIECPVKAPFYLWRKLRIKNTKYKEFLHQEDKELIIAKATRSDSGTYQCKSTGYFNKSVTNITLKVIDPTEMQSKSQDCSLIRETESYKGLCFVNPFYTYQPPKSYKISETVILDCSAASSRTTNQIITPTYLWSWREYSNDRDYDTYKQIITKHENASHLIIPSVQSKDQGWYHCEVVDQFKNKINRTFEVFVQDKSVSYDLEISGQSKQNVTLKKGLPVILKCEVRSQFNRIHSVKWGKRLKLSDGVASEYQTGTIVNWDSFNYHPLPADVIRETRYNNTHISSTITLDYNDQNADEIIGYYICVAMNSRGRTSHKLFFVKKPFKTTNPELTNRNKLHNSTDDNNNQYKSEKNPFVILYIVLPAIIIVILLFTIIFCCIKDRERRANHKSPYTASNNTNNGKSPIPTNSSIPLKKYNTNNSSHINSENNYYYPITTSNHCCTANNSNVIPLSSSSSSTNPPMIYQQNYPNSMSLPPPHFPSHHSTNESLQQQQQQQQQQLQQQQQQTPMLL